MKMKVSNYVADRLVGKGIGQAFMMTRGGAMHLDGGLRYQEGLHCIYNYRKQACAVAAETYARTHNRIAALCVTTDPGETNATTGAVGGWLDSIPTLVLLGQMRYDTTTRWSGVGIRTMGNQEFDIYKAIDCMAKYSEMIVDPTRIHYCLEGTLYLTRSGRPGPCWLDIPLSVQGVFVKAEALPGFGPTDYEAGGNGWAGKDGGHRMPGDETKKGEHRRMLSGKADASTACTIIDKIRAAKRPVIDAGSGIRIVGAHGVFVDMAEKLDVPVITGWDNEDIMYDTHPLYVGRADNMEGRPGNFAVQNSDLVLLVGSRLNVRQAGYSFETWAREAYVIVNDIDEEGLKKPSVRSDMQVHADAKDLLEQLNLALDRILAEGEGGLPKNVSRPDGRQAFDGGEGLRDMTWSRTCVMWREKYPVIPPKHFTHTDEEPANVHVLIHAVSSRLKGEQVAVAGNGSAYAVGGHVCITKKGQRFITNSTIASMGYDPPATIGTWTASRDKGCYCQGEDRSGDDLVLVAGDGSMQMNLQELQIIIHHRTGIKIFVINNGGHHFIRQTQKNFFEEPLIGIGVDNRDLSFPALDKLAAAYGYPYMSAGHNSELGGAVEETLAAEGPVICEISVSIDQNFEPKSSVRKPPDGTVVLPPLEDLPSFLPDKEMDESMIIPEIKGQVLPVNRRAGLSQGIRDKKEYVLCV